MCLSTGLFHINCRSASGYRTCCGRRQPQCWTHVRPWQGQADAKSTSGQSTRVYSPCCSICTQPPGPCASSRYAWSGKDCSLVESPWPIAPSTERWGCRSHRLVGACRALRFGQRYSGTSRTVQIDSTQLDDVVNYHVVRPSAPWTSQYHHQAGRSSFNLSSVLHIARRGRLVPESQRDSDRPARSSLWRRGSGYPRNVGS